jgi:hypothetical protein
MWQWGKYIDQVCRCWLVDEYLYNLFCFESTFSLANVILLAQETLNKLAIIQSP